MKVAVVGCGAMGSVSLFKWDTPAWTTGTMAFGGEMRLGVAPGHFMAE